MVRLMMVPHRGVPVVAVHVSERHRRGSEPDNGEDNKGFFENKFHGNPSGSVRLVSVEKRDAKPEATAMRRHFNPVTRVRIAGRAMGACTSQSIAQPICLAPTKMLAEAVTALRASACCAEPHSLLC
jgi:hypothetical protein